MATLTKEAKLKKLLIKTGCFAALLLLALVITGLLVSSYDDSTLADQTQKQNQNNAVNAEYREIETNIGIQGEVIKYHDAYVKTNNDSMVISRDIVTNLVSSLRKEHHLSNNMEMTVSPIAEITDNTVTAKSGKPVKSTVRISFGALSDNSVYNFVYDLQHKLPGVVVISDLKISKTGDLSRDSVKLATNQHIILPIVTGEVTFVWLGVRPHAEEQAQPGR